MFVTIVLFISDLIIFPFSFDLSVLFFELPSSSYLLPTWMEVLFTEQNTQSERIPFLHSTFFLLRIGVEKYARETHMDWGIAKVGRVEWPACYIRTTKLGAERWFFLLLRILPWVGWSGVDEMERIDCYNTSSIDNLPSRMDRAMGDWIGWQQDTSLVWWWMIPDVFPFPTSRRDRMGWDKQHKIYLLMGSWWGCAVAVVVVMHACLE